MMPDQIDALIPRTQGRKAMGLSRTTEWRRERDDPTFPKRVQIGPGSWAYRVSDVQRWIETRPTVRRS